MSVNECVHICACVYSRVSSYVYPCKYVSVLPFFLCACGCIVLQTCVSMCSFACAYVCSFVCVCVCVYRASFNHKWHQAMWLCGGWGRWHRFIVVMCYEKHRHLTPQRKFYVEGHGGFHWKRATFHFNNEYPWHTFRAMFKTATWCLSLWMQQKQNVPAQS